MAAPAAAEPGRRATDSWAEPGRILVVSCYELGHQPLAAATAIAFLERAGFRPQVLDLAVEPLEALSAGRSRRLVALSVPMHTALHVGVAAARRLRVLAPGAHLCFFGLYATLNAEHLLGGIADSVIGGECEDVLVDLAGALERGRPLETVEGLGLPRRPAAPRLRRVEFPVPSRAALPPLERYARLAIDGATRPAAAVESSRGCLHHCRHCPIPPVYGGRFFAVPRETVLEDVRRLVAAGVRHVTFADPDFFNGPTHALRIVSAMHASFPELTFDATIKVEHVLRHRERFVEMARAGCIFVVSAVESLSDEVLDHLDKGHTREDVFEALSILRRAAIALRPSFVAFTPWTTLGDYLDVLDWIEREDLVGHVDPVQFSIRLLVPPGSLLASYPALQPHLRGLDRERFSWRWEHPDPRMDRLQREVAAIVEDAARSGEEAPRTFARILDRARGAAGLAPTGPTLPARLVSRPPRLTEPWFC